MQLAEAMLYGEPSPAPPSCLNLTNAKLLGEVQCSYLLAFARPSFLSSASVCSSLDAASRTRATPMMTSGRNLRRAATTAVTAWQPSRPR